MDHGCLSGVVGVLKNSTPGWSASQLPVHFPVTDEIPLPISSVLKSSPKSEPSGECADLPRVKNFKKFDFTRIKSTLRGKGRVDQPRVVFFFLNPY